MKKLKKACLLSIALIFSLALNACEEPELEEEHEIWMKDGRPAWSPSGEYIVFTNPSDGRPWIMDADGSNWRQLTFNH